MFWICLDFFCISDLNILSKCTVTSEHFLFITVENLRNFIRGENLWSLGNMEIVQMELMEEHWHELKEGSISLMCKIALLLMSVRVFYLLCTIFLIFDSYCHSSSLKLWKETLVPFTICFLPYSPSCPKDSNFVWHPFGSFF